MSKRQHPGLSASHRIDPYFDYNTLKQQLLQFSRIASRSLRPISISSFASRAFVWNDADTSRIRVAKLRKSNNYKKIKLWNKLFNTSSESFWKQQTLGSQCCRAFKLPRPTLTFSDKGEEENLLITVVPIRPPQQQH